MEWVGFQGIQWYISLPCKLPKHICILTASSVSIFQILIEPSNEPVANRSLSSGLKLQSNIVSVWPWKDILIRIYLTGVKIINSYHHYPFSCINREKEPTDLVEEAQKKD